MLHCYSRRIWTLSSVFCSYCSYGSVKIYPETAQAANCTFIPSLIQRVERTYCSRCKQEVVKLKIKPLKITE